MLNVCYGIKYVDTILQYLAYNYTQAH